MACHTEITNAKQKSTNDVSASYETARLSPHIIIQFHPKHLDAKVIEALPFVERAILGAHGSSAGYADHEAQVS